MVLKSTVFYYHIRALLVNETYSEIKKIVC
jgi:hypothetical protein